MKERVRWMMVFLVVALLVPFVAMAQEAGSEPTIAIPYVAQIIGVIVSVFALVSAIIPDSKMPKIVAKIVNFLALNFGQAKNAE